MTKIYGMYGYREVNIHIPLGNGRNFLQREFTRGNPLKGAYYRPATYVSSDTTEQAMIESSPMFGNQIKLVRTIEDEQPEQQEAVRPAARQTVRRSTVSRIVEPKQPEGQPEGQNSEFHEEVTTREQLISLLKSRGVKATTLASEEAVDRYIESHNLVFPNLNK